MKERDEFLRDEDKVENFTKFQQKRYEFLGETETLSTNTKTAYWIVLGGLEYIEEAKNKYLYELSQKEIKEIIRDLPTVSRSVKKGTFSAINGYFIWALNKGYISENKCEDIDLKEVLNFNKALVKDMYQTLDEFYEFLDNLEDVTDIDKMAIVMLRYDIPIKHCGSIRWEDVDRENKTIIIHNENGKILPIDDRFIERVDRAKACNFNKLCKNIFYNDHGNILKSNSNSNATVLSDNTVYGKIKSINKKNNTNISKIALFKARKIDLLLDTYKTKGEVLKEDVWNVVTLLDGYCTEDKQWATKTHFESVTDIKTVTIKQLNRREKLKNR